MSVAPTGEAAADAVRQAETRDGVVQRGSASLTFRRLRRDKASMGALAFILLLLAFASAAPLVEAWTGHSPIAQDRQSGMTAMGLPVGPRAEFPLGTDHLGRDVLVRLAYGARVSLLVGVFASLAAATVGLSVGVLAGYLGGWVDVVLSRAMDLVMSVPFLLCALALVSVCGPGLWLSVGVIVFFTWTTMGRVVRAEVVSLSRRDFVRASRSLGAGPLSIMGHDILPNLSVPIIVYTTLMIPSAIVFEATLSFLGLGIVPPAPSWGGMLSDAAANGIYLVAWWLVAVPGAALLMTTLAFNILGDGLRDALDPKPRPIRRASWRGARP